ncbi:MAG: metallophosphoesterase, partial [Schleiferiaceae bacterium]|nr:metallophosphoesterase [Schleiferiaceae bacterium]
MALIIIGILVGANIYLAQRFAYFFDLASTLPLYILFPFITIFMIWTVMGLVNSLSSVGHILWMAGAITMGLVLYLLIATIGVDLISLAISIPPATKGWIAIALTVLISGYGLWNATQTKVNEVDITIDGLKEPIRAAHLTDTHLGHFRGGEKLQQIVEMINKEKVDVVFFTGDLLDAAMQLKPEAMQPLQNLNAPVYFIEGNHDEYTGVKAIKEYLKSIGIHVLENEVTHFKELQVVGLT